MIFDLETVYFAFLVAMRAAALLFLMPLIAGRTVPRLVRAALGLIVAWLIFDSVPLSGQMPESVAMIVIQVGQELLIGLLMGFGARMIFFAIEIAGQVIATEIGLMMTSAIDPFSDMQSSIIGRALYMFGVVIFLSLGLHYEVLESFILSFRAVPAGSGYPVDLGMTHFLESTSEIFTIGLKMAGPFIAVNFVITMTFAVLGKAAPKMNVLMVSFAVRIWVGTLVFMLGLGLITQYLVQGSENAPEMLLRYLK